MLNSFADFLMTVLLNTYLEGQNAIFLDLSHEILIWFLWNMPTHPSIKSQSSRIFPFGNRGVIIYRFIVFEIFVSSVLSWVDLIFESCDLKLTENEQGSVIMKYE